MGRRHNQVLEQGCYQREMCAAIAACTEEASGDDGAEWIRICVACMWSGFRMWDMTGNITEYQNRGFPKRMSAVTAAQMERTFGDDDMEWVQTCVEWMQTGCRM
jgi:hypothetical protein